ncbi:MAG: hypothetical protein NT093_04540 [Candidatus Moranbacteria bacterium]|nr:hypothetical protein [Candidatus Moranbacteria bacterium]
MKKYSIVMFFFVPLLLLSGCGKKQSVTGKVPGQMVRQETSVGAEKNQEVSQSAEVPLPQGEDIVKLFFNLINEKKIPEAVAMMDDSAVPDNSAKQAWGVQFDIVDSVAVKSIDPSNIGDETEGQETFKVVLDAKIKPGSENAIMPNFGWENGENIRWVGTKKNSEGMWKILGIGTGP